LKLLKALNRLQQEFSLTQEELLTRSARKGQRSANYLRLLKLPAENKGYDLCRKMSMGHARLCWH